LAALKPSTYLESRNPQVVALARQAIGTTPDAAEAVRRIESFVRSYITTKDYAVGYAAASEVVKTRQGDCTEHAVLAAAMCRAVGIPAKVVAGMAYVDELQGRRHVFGPHAWVMAYLGNQWVHFDPLFPGGYDLGHIALAAGDGDLTDYLNMVSVLGAFEMEAARVQPKSSTTGPARDRKSSPD
jgi:transglutaminase-like putative cysteine protease